MKYKRLMTLVLVLFCTCSFYKVEASEHYRNYSKADIDLLEARNKKPLSSKEFSEYIDTIEAKRDYNIFIDIAYSQLGQVGGYPYWSFFEHQSRANWCAMFVSWCAHEAHLDSKDIMPLFVSCKEGINWFYDNDLYTSDISKVKKGMIIFFDFDNTEETGVPDGYTDHVGIISKVENNLVYVIEGNYNDMVCENVYPIDYYGFLGLGMIDYKL